MLVEQPNSLVIGNDRPHPVFQPASALVQYSPQIFCEMELTAVQSNRLASLACRALSLVDKFASPPITLCEPRVRFLGSHLAQRHSQWHARGLIRQIRAWFYLVNDHNVSGLFPGHRIATGCDRGSNCTRRSKELFQSLKDIPSIARDQQNARNAAICWSGAKRVFCRSRTEKKREAVLASRLGPSTVVQAAESQSNPLRGRLRFELRRPNRHRCDYRE